MTGYVKYDAEADMLYVRFSNDPIDHTKPVDDLRMIDYSVDNAVVGLEFVDASGGVDLRDLPFRQKAELLLGDSGLGLPLLV